MASRKILSSLIKASLLIGCALVHVSDGFSWGVLPYLAHPTRLPGIKARITQKGLDFVTDIGVKWLHEHIDEFPIPDQRGSASIFDYAATRIRISSFGLPATITPVPQQGLKLRVDRAFFNVRGVLEYWCLFHHSGTFEIQLADISLTTIIQIGVDSTGRPKASAGSCYFHVGSVKASLPGIASWGDSQAESTVMDTLNSQACGQIQQAINTKLEDKLRNLKVIVPYKNMFRLDLSLTGSPNFNGTVDTAHKGEVYPIYSRTESWITIPTVPQDSDKSSRMMLLWITDYLPNSACFVLQETGQLKYNLTPQNAPAEAKQYLNTSSMPMKMVFPQVNEMYPNMAMLISLNSTRAPVFRFTPKGIEVNLNAEFSPYAVLPNKTKALLFTLNVAVTANFTVGSNGNNLTWIVSYIGTVFKEVHSNVGPLNIRDIQMKVKMAMGMFILPQINKMGKVGVALPKYEDFEMMHMNITPGWGFMKLGANLRHPASFYFA